MSWVRVPPSPQHREIVAVVARKAHNLEVGGSNPPLATNISWGGLEMVPAESHKPNDVGSNPTPATKMSFPTPKVSE